MKIKQEIEWVVGENPESTATKLIAIKDDGGILIQTGSFYADEEMSAPCWHFENGETVPMQHAEVIAWASMPTFDGFPAEGQNVEFTDAYRCDNPLCDPARTRRLVKAVEFIAKRLSLQVGRQFADADVYERQELNQTIKRLDTIRDYILNGKEPEA